MDTNKGGLGGFLRDTARAVISGPGKRPAQPAPVKRPEKGLWGNLSYMTKDRMKRDFQKFRKLPDGKRIKLKEEELSGLVDTVFPDKKEIISRDEAIRRIGKFTKSEARRRNTGISVSEQILSRHKVEIAQARLIPGPKEMGPKETGLGIGKNIGNIFRVATGRPITTEPKPAPDPFSVQQNNQSINQTNENIQK